MSKTPNRVPTETPGNKTSGVGGKTSKYPPTLLSTTEHKNGRSLKTTLLINGHCQVIPPVRPST